MAARVGLAPTPRGLTGRRATLTPLGEWRCGPDNRRRGKVEIGGPEGVRTLSLPADNGLLC